jgi:hypothetical protein
VSPLEGTKMPTKFEVDGSLVIATCEGEFTLEDGKNMVNWVATDPSVPEHARLLVHDRSSTFDASSEGLEDLAVAFAKIGDRMSHRWAIVVEKTYHYGLARMFSVFGERHGLTTQIFTSVDEAKKWLMKDVADD